MFEELAAGAVRGASERGDAVFVTITCLVSSFLFVGVTISAVLATYAKKTTAAVGLMESAITKLVASADERMERSIEKMEERARDDRMARETELRLLRETIAENNRTIGRNSVVLETAARHWSVPKNGG